MTPQAAQRRPKDHMKASLDTENTPLDTQKKKIIPRRPPEGQYTPKHHYYHTFEGSQEIPQPPKILRKCSQKPPKTTPRAPQKVRKSQQETTDELDGASECPGDPWRTLRDPVSPMGENEGI